MKYSSKFQKNLTGVSPSMTGGAYSGSLGSAKWFTNCAIPENKGGEYQTSLGSLFNRKIIIGGSSHLYMGGISFSQEEVYTPMEDEVQKASVDCW